MSADQTRQVMSAYFEALETGHSARYFNEDVTWTTVASDTQVRGPDAVEALINGLHDRLKDLQTGNWSLVRTPPTSRAPQRATTETGESRTASRTTSWEGASAPCAPTAISQSPR